MWRKYLTLPYMAAIHVLSQFLTIWTFSLLLGPSRSWDFSETDPRLLQMVPTILKVVLDMETSVGPKAHVWEMAKSYV